MIEDPAKNIVGVGGRHRFESTQPGFGERGGLASTVFVRRFQVNIAALDEGAQTMGQSTLGHIGGISEIRQAKGPLRRF